MIRAFETWLPEAQKVATGMWKRFSRAPVERDDMLQMAALALWVALPRYDPRRDRDQGRYVRCQVRNGILDQLRAQHSISRPNRSDWGIELCQAGLADRHIWDRPQFAILPTVLEDLEAEDEREQQYAVIDRVLPKLTDTEQIVVCSRLSGDPISIIAKRIRATEGYVSQSWAKSIQKIRRAA